MILFAAGPLFIGIAPDADCSIFYTGRAFVVHLWRVRIEWDHIRRQGRGPVQKNRDQLGHGSSMQNHGPTEDAGRQGSRSGAGVSLLHSQPRQLPQVGNGGRP